MANKTIFASYAGALLPAADALNREGAGAYAYEAKHLLAQYAATGCIGNTFYAGAGEQVELALRLGRVLEPEFVAKTALYARESAFMKDMPALLLAILSTRDSALLKRVFARVIDNGRMLRSFVQIMRSGVVGRKSLGSAPKALVQAWLLEASDAKLIDACVGNDPSLADILRMVHPKPASRSREALFGWVLGKPYAVDALPVALQAHVRFRIDRSAGVPEVPFQLLADLDLSAQEWASLARRGGWHMVRMNLKTFARRGVFAIAGMAEAVAEKLRDAEAIAKARVLPYQLLAAHRASEGLPGVVREALEDALELALRNLRALPGRVVVCPDVSGSMSAPVTGTRRGASTAVRCIDVAALMAAAVLRVNPDARVLPFEDKVRTLDLNPRDTVMSNALRMAAIGGGGTNCSAPLAMLNASKEAADLVIFVSDNQSWVDARSAGATEMMLQWQRLKQRNPRARLVCIDIQAHGSTQAAERPDVLNVGGFSDAVFGVLDAFAAGELAAGGWVERIEAAAIC